MRISLPHVTAAVFLLCALSVSPHSAAGQSPAIARGERAQAILALERGSISLHPTGGWSLASSAVPHQERWLSAAAYEELGRSDPMRSALVGAGIGAVIGAAGFAAVTYIANQDGEGRHYWPLAFGVGGLVGGAVGFIVGISYAAR